MKKRIFFENLDGLRFFCFLSVFFFHSFFTDFDYIKHSYVYSFIKKDVFGNGNLGVNFFFVLSGFLITYLLIEEKKISGKIDLKNFWLRRILRIWPLFYFCVIFGFFVFPLIKSAFGQQSNESANIFYYLTFLNNFDFLKNGLPDSSVLGVLWSVAIEEQFYFVWPIILYFLPVSKYWVAFGTIILTSWIFRGCYDNSLIHEHHTLSCIGDMAIGAFGAWLIQERIKFKTFIENRSRLEIYSLYIMFLLIFFFRDEVFYKFYLLRIFERSFIAIIILFIIMEQNYSRNSFYKMSNFKRISSLGTITYGLYCLHFIGILITIKLTSKLGFNTQLWQVIFVDSIVSLIITITISKLSYKYYEKPFLKFKDRFSIITK